MAETLNRPIGPERPPTPEVFKATSEQNRRYPADIEALLGAETKKQLDNRTVNLLESLFLECNSPEMPISDWIISGATGEAHFRAIALRRPIQELIEDEIIDPNELSGNDNRCKARAPGYALREEVQVTEKRVVFRDRQGNVREGTKPVKELIQVFGSNEERQAMSEVMLRRWSAVNLALHIAQMKSWIISNSENLGGLAKMFLFNQPYPDGQKNLYNLPEKTNRAERIDAVNMELREGKAFGDKIDVAERILFLVALSEKPTELQKYVNSPGVKLVFGDDPNNVEKYLGKPAEWKKEYDYATDSSFRTKRSATTGEKREVTEENTGRIRGVFTEFGNIFSDGRVYEIDEIKKRIVDFLGGDVSAKVAAEIAWTKFFLDGKASHYGFEKFPQTETKGGREVLKKDSQGRLFLDVVMEAGFPQSNDLIKVIHPDLFRYWYRSKGRGGGPKTTIWNYARLAVELDKHNTFKFVVNGEEVTRSVHELEWFGDPSGKVYRKGEIYDDPKLFGQMSDKALNKERLSIFFAGREENGLFDLINRSNFDLLKEFIDSNFWGEVSKKFGIAISPAVAVEGDFINKGNIAAGLANMMRCESIISLIRAAFNSPAAIVQGGKIERPNGDKISAFEPVCLAINEAAIGLTAQVLDNGIRISYETTYDSKTRTKVEAKTISCDLIMRSK